MHCDSSGGRQVLLKEGLRGMDGVVFLNERDEQMVLTRVGRRVLPLARSGISPERRFTFYDQVHTTGMDIAQSLSATAAQTIGKDMTFRDYAQVTRSNMHHTPYIACLKCATQSRTLSNVPAGVLVYVSDRNAVFHLTEQYGKVVMRQARKRTINGSFVSHTSSLENRVP